MSQVFRAGHQKTGPPFLLFYKTERLERNRPCTLTSCSHSSASTSRNTTSSCFRDRVWKKDLMVLQGWHHVAEKSTATSCSPASFSATSKSSLLRITFTGSLSRNSVSSSDCRLLSPGGQTVSSKDLVVSPSLGRMVLAEDLGVSLFLSRIVWVEDLGVWPSLSRVVLAEDLGVSPSLGRMV